MDSPSSQSTRQTAVIGAALLAKMTSKSAASRCEGLDVRACAGPEVVLGVNVGGRAELGRELDDVAAADLQPALFVDTASQGIDLGRKWIRLRRGVHGRRIVIERGACRRPIPCRHRDSPLGTRRSSFPGVSGSRLPASAFEEGVEGGRPYLLWRPRTSPPWPGMLVIHGAGSRKENHADFARAGAARGWMALAYDQRGHGAASDEMGPAALADVTRMARFLGAIDGVDAGRICARGSSMGGFVAIHAAASSDAIAGVIAVCPASEEGLRRGLRDGDLEMRAGDEAVAALDAWLGELDLRDAVELMGRKPLVLVHARGDERVPYTWSEELFARAAEPRKLVLVPGGHHRSAQHDAELQEVSLRWLERALACA